jgi:hypothetical protein
LNIIAYLSHHPNSKLVMNPSPMGHLRDPDLQSSFNHDAEWYEFYGDVHEEIPSDAPIPLGK